MCILCRWMREAFAQLASVFAKCEGESEGDTFFGGKMDLVEFWNVMRVHTFP